MPIPKHVPEQLGNLQDNTDGLGSTIENSLLASKPLLRKTGGRDIYAQQSLLYLYTNDKHANQSTEFLGEQLQEGYFPVHMTSYILLTI